MEHNLLLALEYDGSAFSGWQRQPERRTVQQVVEEALGRLAGSPRTAIAAGRTDAGVHALGMPVSTAMPAHWTAAELLRALNAVLPRDVAVTEIRRTTGAHDARRGAEGRRYRYDIATDARSRSPFRGRTEWPLGRPLDLAAMQRAAAVLLGEHEFLAFMVTGEPKPHYRCRIIEASWLEVEAGRVRFTVAADRFLHHMVRMLVGTMVEIGLERRPESDMARLLTLRHNAETSSPAPPEGLTFLSAVYPDTYFLEERAAW
jgi:tRNA pseudouridine38-40 synthase